MQVSSVSNPSIMPYNDKTEKLVSKIDKKITELKKRILYLESIHQRKTHGGKKFRAKKLSRRNERDYALRRLKKLEVENSSQSSQNACSQKGEAEKPIEKILQSSQNALFQENAVEKPVEENQNAASQGLLKKISVMLGY